VNLTSLEDANLQLIHRELRNSRDVIELDTNLRTYLRNPGARNQLYEPLLNYNLFAKGLNGCDISADNPYWERDYTLGDVITIRVRGLNSVLVSNLQDNITKKLILGSHQLLLENDDNVEYIILCHHPPDWLIDHDSVHVSLVSDIRVQLFGHKHDLRKDRMEDSIRLVAGALHPSRAERQWIPRYNYIEIWLDERDGVRQINYRIHPRVWFKDDTRFWTRSR